MTDPVFFITGWGGRTSLLQCAQTWNWFSYIKIFIKGTFINNYNLCVRILVLNNFWWNIKGYDFFISWNKFWFTIFPTLFQNFPWLCSKSNFFFVKEQKICFWDVTLQQRQWTDTDQFIKLCQKDQQIWQKIILR